MLNLRVFVTALCFILGGFLNVATAQTGSQDANDWIALQSGPNIFALREALENDLQASDGVRALAVAYIGAFSRDFDIANQRLDYARRYARARNDVVFAEYVERVEDILLREQGRFQALATRLGHGAGAASPWGQRVAYWSEKLTTSYIGAPEFSLSNISPDDVRIILPVSFSDVGGTLLFDSGAEGSLLSPEFADKFDAVTSGVNFSMLTIDGPRLTELASVPDLVIGAAKFGEVTVGIQNQVDGVIGFFLNQGATGIMGFPLMARFGRIDFNVEEGRVDTLTFYRPGKRDKRANEPNIMIREDKPYAKVTLDGETYSCIFDTGAPRSLFSKAIVERYQERLALEVLTRKQAKSRGLGGAKKVKYVSSVPVRAGHREIVLENVHMVETAAPDTDFCIIGLDAVIKAGGARLDLNNLHLTFGSQNNVNHAFNLR